jgi:hypothetical protein
MRVRVSPESMVLAAICTVDMLLTLILVQFRLAAEQNPLMSACLNHGDATFVIVKLASFIPFIALVEVHRARNPIFVRNATRWAIVLYIAVYVMFFVRANFLS